MACVTFSRRADKEPLRQMITSEHAQVHCTYSGHMRCITAQHDTAGMWYADIPAVYCNSRSWCRLVRKCCSYWIKVAQWLRAAWPARTQLLSSRCPDRPSGRPEGVKRPKCKADYLSPSSVLEYLRRYSPEVWFPAEARYCLCSTASRPVLGPSQSAIRRVFSPAVKRPRREADHRHLIPRSVVELYLPSPLRLHFVVPNLLSHFEVIAYLRFRHLGHFFMEPSDYYDTPVNKVVYFIRGVGLIKG
jgi:hypothetical protein